MANKIILTGRIVRDSELSFIPNTGTAKMTYTLAVERNYQKDKNNKKVDFINCEMIGKHTENLCKYVTKGKLVYVEGELNIDNYEKDGEKRSYTKVKVDKLEFLGGTNQDSKSNDTGNSDFQPVDDDEFIPF